MRSSAPLCRKKEQEVGGGQGMPGATGSLTFHVAVWKPDHVLLSLTNIKDQPYSEP